MPNAWRERADNVKQGSSDEVHESSDGFMEIVQKHFERSVLIYEEMIQNGVAPEMARMVLPQSMFVEWIWTGSLHAWARIYNQRIDNHAQRETQQIAKLIGEAIEPLFPVSWKVLTKDHCVALMGEKE
jgi:thymidylate synthase (FAD)